MPDLHNFGHSGVLRADVEYGVHVALTCRNHPELRWSTKNVAPIGARNIFFSGQGWECACTLKDLVVVPPAAQAPRAAVSP